MSFLWILFFVAWNSLNPTDAADNIAQRKPTSSSSVQYGLPSSNAVDGNHKTRMTTADFQRFAWWRVDLQTLVTDAKIVVYFRTGDYEVRRPGLQFYVSKSDFNSPQSSSWSPWGQVRHIHKTVGSYHQIPDVYTVNTTGEWRYLLIYTNTRYDQWGSVLDFKEIEVWACLKGFYDPNCTRNCNTRLCSRPSSCPYNTGVCQNGCRISFTGIDCTDCSVGLYGDRCNKACSDRHCFGPAPCTRYNYNCHDCQAGWMDDDCTTDAADNIALGRPTRSSSVNFGLQSSNAVNGNHTIGIATADYETFAWWRVDLQTQVTDAKIVVYFRTGNYEVRRPGLQFYVSKSGFNSPQSSSWSPWMGVRLIHKTSGNYHQIPDVYTVNTTEEWRYLLIYTNTLYDKWRSVLDFNEIEVWACPEGLYYPNCTRNCNTRLCLGPSSCPYNTGVCQNGCQRGYTGMDCTDCPVGLYGDGCVKYCSRRNCFGPATCTRYNYNCHDCQPGWTGGECTAACFRNQYGKKCVKQCAARRCKVYSTTCNRFTGECPGGCGEAGYKLPDCTERCQANVYYGINCSKKCDERKCESTSSSCDISTGKCPGCHEGWMGIDCTKECDSGRYGQNCSRLCNSRNCLNQSHTCDHVTGTCPGGCRAGWRGEDCTEECPKNTYGRKCELMCDARKCKQPSSTCNRTTGVCPDGCQDGWTGVDCSSKCPVGRYFSGCSKRCGERHCKLLTSSCSAVDGACDTGCGDGWTSTDCTLRCTKGTYGFNCSHNCGNCSGDGSCDHVTGLCLKGCEPGLKPGLCQNKCSNSTYGKDCKNRCGNCKGSCHEVDGHCLSGCVGDFKGDLCAEAIVKDQGTSSGLIGGLCGAFILLGIVAVVAVILWRRKRKLPSTGGKQGTIATPLDESIYVNVMDSKDRDKDLGANQDKMKINNGKRRSDDVKPQVDYKSKPKVAVKPLTSNNHVPAETPNNLEEPEGEEELFEERPGNDYYNLSDVDPIRGVTLPELVDIVKTVQQRHNGFLAEYNRLPWGFAAPYDDSQKPENAGKNKFRGYYPFDQNRVRLQSIPNIPGSDYINASFIQNYNKKKMYIAAQAANKKTVGDFWRMIWEHKCNRIVMLTGLIEQTRVKCELYWPEDDPTQTDEFEIQSKCTDKRADYTVRQFAVTSKSTQERRTVVHYHYTTWPDHGVPNTLSLVKFIWDIRRTDADTDGPLLVHCSAGIGRTGTYIAVDSLYDQARDEGKVDVPAYVAEMRSQRKNMIQTHEQYECVFLCLVEMTTYGDTSLSSSDFFNMYSSRGMDTEVDGRSLNQLTELALSEPRSGDPKSHTMWVDGNQEFIVKHNPSFSNLQGYLLAVAPAPPLTKLLWKLVDENEVQTVLVISPLKNDIIGPNGQRVKYGNIEVKTQKTEEVSNELSIVTLQLTETNQTSNVPKSVNLYLITGKDTTETLPSLIKDKSQMQSFSTDLRQTVIVHSKADRQNAVLLCIMSNIIEEIRSDDRVDVIRHIRKYLQHSSDVQLTKDDAERLHRFVHQYLQMTDNTNTYANM